MATPPGAGEVAPSRMRHHMTIPGESGGKIVAADGAGNSSRVDAPVARCIADFLCRHVVPQYPSISFELASAAIGVD